MLGNAVTPNAARDLVAMAVEALTGESIELSEAARRAGRLIPLTAATRGRPHILTAS
jgi:hypothetical protein